MQIDNLIADEFNADEYYNSDGLIRIDEALKRVHWHNATLFKLLYYYGLSFIEIADQLR